MISLLEKLLNVFGNTATVERIENSSELYTANSSKFGEITICAKDITFGGRENLSYEQRVQIKGKSNNYAFDRLNQNKKAVLLGVSTESDGEIVICAWKLKYSTASNTISKQIKNNIIENALKGGFAQQLKGSSEFACAFRKEFLYFYLSNSEWIHSSPIEQLINHVDSEKIGCNLNDSIKEKYNRIVFGAPGTGKSYLLEKDRKDFGDKYERVTFHPNYSYGQFVGTYKPVPTKDSEDKDSITYEYVPGPFMRVLVEAMRSMKEEEPKPYLLIIEEINRVNVASVFGEVFQLLDRECGESEYEIETSQDMRNYLQKELQGDISEYEKMKIPSNMYIWATMNSADQGVFPMDTAFKRRWDFEYININDNEEGIKGIKVALGKDKHYIDWNELRKAINNVLLNVCRVNEDKLLGPYFVSKSVLEVDNDGFVKDNDKFIKTFKSKVLMYIYEDAAGRQHRSKIFSKCSPTATYSMVCSDLDKIGEGIFGEHMDLKKHTRTNEEQVK